MEVRRKNAGYVEGGRGGEADDGWEVGGGGTGMFERDHEVGHAVRHTVRRREAAPL